MLSEYQIVKGNPDVLNADLKKKTIGLRESPVEFECLVKADDATFMPPGVVVETPTLDEIVVYHTNKRDI